MKTKNKKSLILIVVAVLLVVPFLTLGMKYNDASGLSRACASSPECVAAAAKEAEANKAERLSDKSGRDGGGNCFQGGRDC